MKLLPQYAKSLEGVPEIRTTEGRIYHIAAACIESAFHALLAIESINRVNKALELSNLKQDHIS